MGPTQSDLTDWSPASWRQKPVLQLPEYPDPDLLQQVLKTLSQLPPLVTSWEVESLREQLAEVAAGQRFLLQGGDCSESFDDCQSEVITNKLKILLQMSLILIQASKKRVTRVGRIAGQYAKPRSIPTETRDGVTLPTYRGDLVNHPGFSPWEREPDPRLMLKGYGRAALTLNFIRALVDGGFADLHHPEYWDLEFVSHSPQSAEYQRIVESLGDSLRFFETVAGRRGEELQRVDFFTSHEGLHLPYEQAQTRRVPHRIGWYDLSTHFPWLGNRTRQLGGAHVEFFRGISNPIGAKIGPEIGPDELLQLVDLLNPENVAGRLTLIHRFGAGQIDTLLPPLIGAVKRQKRIVVWCCDPMHGNTQRTSSGIKTRDFGRILKELEKAFQIHRGMDSYLGGVHFELTGEDVTECVGGARGLREADLSRDYRSQLDPRLNYEQALEMALLIANMI